MAKIDRLKYLDVMRDSAGKPIRVFHGGTNIDFDAFRIGTKGNDQFGPGIYFTTKPSEASSYTSRQDRMTGEDLPIFGAGVRSAYLKIRNPIVIRGNVKLDDDHIRKRLTLQAALRGIKQAPDYEERLWNYGDLSSEPKAQVLRKAAQQYVDTNGWTMLWLDFYREEPEKFLKWLSDETGYDGVRVEITKDVTHYVAWSPTQIVDAYFGESLAETIARSEKWAFSCQP